MRFAVEAMRPDGTTVNDLLDAAARAEAVDTLRAKGLIVLNLREVADTSGNAAGAAGAERGGMWQRRAITNRDMILFTRQMKMLLEAGAPLVPALEAAEHQTTKPAVRALLQRLRGSVEEGASLAAALEEEKVHFDAVFRTMVAAGEATATLPQVFGRLCGLAQQQQQTRKLVVGAALYPIILSGLLSIVINVLMFFVVPRFKILFTSLNSPLPPTTHMLFNLSTWLRGNWPYVLVGLLATVGGLILCWRLPSTRRTFDELIVRVPGVGAVVSRLMFARVIRIWAAMLRCHVPLLEAIQQSRQAITNGVFLRLIDSVEESVSGGGHVGQALEQAHLADPVIVSAIRTGEDNGRLAEACDFVSTWMDEDNVSMVQQLTRLAEPLLLAVMGVVVGFVAMSLFIPLFDIATAAG